MLRAPGNSDTGPPDTSNRLLRLAVYFWCTFGSRPVSWEVSRYRPNVLVKLCPSVQLNARLRGPENMTSMRTASVISFGWQVFLPYSAPETVASLWNKEYFSSHQLKMREVRQTYEESFWKKVWSDTEPAVRAIVGDTFVFLVILASLALVYLCLGWLAGLGYDATRIERFDTMHYWAYLGVLGIFLLGFVIRMALQAFKPKDK
jgi:hypothetical protein